MNKPVSWNLVKKQQLFQNLSKGIKILNSKQNRNEKSYKQQLPILKYTQKLINQHLKMPR